MKLALSKTAIGNIDVAIRRAGYNILLNRRSGQKSYVHRLSHDLYPRFHLYIEDAGENWQLNLHLDQRAPVYEGVTAHAGEYDGELVEREAARIQNTLSKKEPGN